MCYIDLGRRYCNGRNALPRSGNSATTGTCRPSRCSIGGENMSFWDWDLDGDEDLMDDVLEFEILNGEFDDDAYEKD